MDLFKWAAAEEQKLKSLKVDKEEVILSVDALNKLVKDTLEGSLQACWVRGEISNFKRHSSGHCYFSIKDNNSVISCVIWKFSLPNDIHNLKDGQEVTVYGNVRVFQKGGRYNLEITKIKQNGIGSLHQQFEDLKNELYKKGYFLDKHKQLIPDFCLNIGVITAETGAAFKDIRRVIRSRAPFVNIFLYNARVQGPKAELTIIEGIKLFNKKRSSLDIGLLIIGRGGGSLEDLWCFNQRTLAQAVFDSKLPIISGVGHEIDFVITDFVADKRAATPSQAAELATLSVKDQLEILDTYRVRMQEAVNKKIDLEKNILLNISKSHAFLRPRDIINNYYMELDSIHSRFVNSYENFISINNQKLKNLHDMLNALGHESILKRGYAIVKNKEEIITSKKKAKEYTSLNLTFRDGDLEVFHK